jgi:hypothetical protein
LIKKQAPRSVTVSLTPKIAPNDLKTKLAKVKTELAPERRVAKVFVEVTCPPNQMDQANALLLSVQRMFEGVLQLKGKPSVSRNNEKDESSEIMDEDEVLEAMENPESAEEQQKGDKSATAPQISVVFRQEYSNPAFTNQVVKEKVESKDQKESKEPVLQLNDAEVKALVDREFSKITAKSAGDFDIDTVVREDTHTRMEKMFQVTGAVEFEPDVGFVQPIKLNPAWTQRMFDKVDRLDLLQKGLIVAKKRVLTKKQKSMGMTNKLSKDLRKIGAGDLKKKKRPIEQDSGLYMDKELLERNEQWTRAEKGTRQKLVTQKEIIKKL